MKRTTTHRQSLSPCNDSRRRNVRGSSEVTILLGLAAAGLLALPLVLTSLTPQGGGGGGGNQDPLAGLPEANEHSFEGPNGVEADPGINNAFTPATLTSGNYPTNGYPSPMYGAGSWEQKLIIFEEFGREPIPTNFDTTGKIDCPAPANAQSCPSSAAWPCWPTWPTSCAPRSPPSKATWKG